MWQMYLIAKRWVPTVIFFKGNRNSNSRDRLWPHTHHKPSAICSYSGIFYVTLPPSSFFGGVPGFLQTMSNILIKFLLGISQNESKAKVLINIHQRRTCRSFQTSFGEEKAIPPCCSLSEFVINWIYFCNNGGKRTEKPCCI